MNNNLRTVWQDIISDDSLAHMHEVAKGHLDKLACEFHTLPVMPIVTINSYFGLFSSPPDWNETCQIGEPNPIEKATAPEKINSDVIDLLDILEDNGRQIVVFDEDSHTNTQLLGQRFPKRTWEIVPAYQRNKYLFEKTIGNTKSYEHLARGTLYPIYEISVSGAAINSVLDKRCLMATHITTTSPFEISR